MTEIPASQSLTQQAHERARLMVAEQGPVVGEVSPIDSVEDMLELAESARTARNMLAQRYNEVHPEPSDLAPEQTERLINHAHFLREVGSISAQDWEHTGMEIAKERDQTIDVSKLVAQMNASDPKKVSSITRPEWQDYFPETIDLEQKDIGDDRTLDSLSEAEVTALKQEKWQKFKGQYPEDMQVLLEELRSSSTGLQLAQENAQLFESFAAEKDKRFDVLMTASAVRSLKRTAQDLRARADSLRLSMPDGASHSAILDQAKQLETEAGIFDDQAGEWVGSNQLVMDELARRSRLDDRRQLRHGLLATEQITEVVDSFVPQLIAGKPVLLVGETGGAKTAAAEEVAQRVNKQLGRKDPNAYEFVSGYGQMNSYQLMGKDTIKDGSVEFVDGAITRAIRAGTPLILDEVNAMDPDILKRLNKVLQLQPGDVFQIQEDGGERITVQKGFCVIVTANEKSSRYKGVNDMSADFKNRFGANIARVHYPDLEILPGQVPKTLLRLAQATLFDQYGNIPKDNPALDPPTILKFVAACHQLQRYFCVPLSDLKSQDNLSDPSLTRNAATGQTALKMETISPRLMTGILDDLVKGGRNGLTLSTILGRYVEGVTDPQDRKLIDSTLRTAYKLL